MSYDKTSDKIKCAICEGTINDPRFRVFKNYEGIEFSKGGFNDWHRLVERTKRRVDSRMHKDAAACNLRLYGEMNSTESFEIFLSSALDTNQIENRQYLKLIMLTIRLLETQGLAFWDHKEDDINSNATIETCAEDRGEKLHCTKKRVLST